MVPDRSDAEQKLFDSALRRIDRMSVVLAAAGCVGCLIWRGWKGGVAFLLGAAAALTYFRWLKRLVNSLGGTAETRHSKKFAVIVGLRYLLLAAGAYVIVNFTPLSLPAALIGLLVPVAAVILEIIFELVAKS
jgi:hypothetical protein